MALRPPVSLGRRRVHHYSPFIFHLQGLGHQTPDPAPPSPPPAPFLTLRRHLTLFRHFLEIGTLRPLVLPTSK
jgi:hypothetical protein